MPRHFLTGFHLKRQVPNKFKLALRSIDKPGELIGADRDGHAVYIKAFGGLP